VKPAAKVEPDYVLVSRDEFFRIVEDTADRVAADYRGRSVVALIALKGAGRFASVLLPLLQQRGVTIDAIYPIKPQSMDGTESSGTLRYETVTPADLRWLDLQDVDMTGVQFGPVDCSGRDVLVFDDIADTLLTLRLLMPSVRSGQLPVTSGELVADTASGEQVVADLRGSGGAPTSAHAVVLYAKQHALPVIADISDQHGRELVKYLGCVIPNLFVVGQGMDYDQQFREYDDLWVAREVSDLESEVPTTAPLVLPVPASIADEGASLDL
jgi:hypoxanthine-guanine phosphoribosyltransferase